MPRKRGKKKSKNRGTPSVPAAAGMRRTLNRDELMEYLRNLHTDEDIFDSEDNGVKKSIIRRTTNGLIASHTNVDGSGMSIEAIAEVDSEKIALVLLGQIIGGDPEDPLPFPRKIIFEGRLIRPEQHQEVINILLEFAEGFYPSRRYQLELDSDVPHDPNTFWIDESALSYLADYMLADMNTLEEYKNLGFSTLEDIDDIRSSDIEGIEDQYVEGIEGDKRKEDQLAKSMPGTGEKDSGDWAIGGTRSAAIRLINDYNENLDSTRALDLFQDGEYSIHHKISRSRIRRLHGEMKSSPDARVLEDAIGRIGLDLNTPSMLNAMLNMPANLEVGPNVKRITEDMGSTFDGNVLDGKPRSYTVRSKDLGEVDLLIDKENRFFDNLVGS